jgi:hypothetical protein
LSLVFAIMNSARKLVENWRWRYRDRKTGRTCRTVFQLTEAEARRVPEAQRIPGSMLLREFEADDFTDTGLMCIRPWRAANS